MLVSGRGKKGGTVWGAEVRLLFRIGVTGEHCNPQVCTFAVYGGHMGYRYGE